MERFDLSFKNRSVRIYFAIIIPLVLAAILLYLVLPNEFHMFPTSLVLIGTVGYCLTGKNKEIVSLLINPKGGQ